jgi:ABC-type transport system involved in multi-copper enzyme maturation permease subunit
VPAASTSPGATATIGDHLAGIFLGLVVLIVVAAMFATAEYRRGLIRITLAAIPSRGRLLAAKATVIGAVTFAAGLVAVGVAVPVGVRISRDSGFYVLPVSGAIEARVIVGTALVLAVCSVLALAVGVILRRGAAAVAAVVVGIVLPYLLGTAAGLPDSAREWLLRVTPAAGFAIGQTIPRYAQVTARYDAPAYFPLGPWAGFAVLCGYATVALAIAYLLLRRRDA